MRQFVDLPDNVRISARIAAESCGCRGLWYRDGDLALWMPHESRGRFDLAAFVLRTFGLEMRTVAPACRTREDDGYGPYIVWAPLWSEVSRV